LATCAVRSTACAADPDCVAAAGIHFLWLSGKPSISGVSRARPGRRLELRAEMRLPGDATLTFEIEPTGQDDCTLTQTARFKPRGLAGLAYWYAVTPLHGIVFQGMLRGIRRCAESQSPPTPPHGKKTCRSATS
jgi:hypothetical protein